MPRRIVRENEKARIERERNTLRSQFKRHSVALISLVVAVVSLGYNTWRNETSELHRNYRQAAFQITSEVNEFQQIVLYRRYFHGREEHMLTPMRDAETWISGWGKVASIRDLTAILPSPLPERGRALHASWEEHAAKLDGESDKAQMAERAIMEDIDQTRDAVIELIEQLR